MASLSFLSAIEIEEIRQILKIQHLEVQLRPEWGSHKADHRESIHSELKKKMAHAYPFSDSSISHCPSMGGFAFTQYDSNHVYQIGFDIEETARIKSKLAERIANDTEFRSAPSPAFLWCAKEAAFKALKGPAQPTVVSDLVLQNWRTIDSQTETVELKFSVKIPFTSIVGVVREKAPYTLAFFVCFP